MTTEATTNNNKRIVVPERSVNGGLDTKYETDPYDIKLHGLLTTQDYTDAITSLNERLKPSRPTNVDTALLVTGPLIVPLGLWGARHSVQVKKRKKLLKVAVDEFNTTHPTLLMRYQRRPLSRLTIERRVEERDGAAPPQSYQMASYQDEGVVGPPPIVAQGEIVPIQAPMKDPGVDNFFV